jgi:hypothetical protein
VVKHTVTRAAVVLAGLTAAVFVLNSVSGAQATVVRPLVACLAVALLFAVIVLRGDDRAQLDEIGLWYMGTLVVYATLPLLTYVALGSQYTTTVYDPARPCGGSDSCVVLRAVCGRIWLWLCSPPPN